MANTVEIHVKAKDSASRVLGGVGKAFKGIASNVAGSIATLAKGATTIAAIGTTAASAAPLLLPAAKAVFSVGQAALQASPALLSFAAAGLFVKATLGQIFKEGSAMRKAIEPLGTAFNKAGDAASQAAAKGVRPLVEEFNRANFPNIRSAMVRIGDATNKVTTGFLKWANSASGVRAIKGIVDPIGRSMQQLAPHITRAGIAFTGMLGRITGVSMAAGTSGLAGVLDKLSSMMDRVNKTSVGGGLSKLGSTARTVGNAVQVAAKWIGKAVDLYKMYQTKFSLVADGVSVAAIAFGGPVAMIAGAVGLIIRHFDDLKRAYEGVKNYFKSPIGKGVLDDMKSSVETVMPAIKQAFKDIGKDAGPALKDLGNTLKNDLLPALADFSKEAAPVVAWLVKHLGKDFANKLAGTITMIDGLATAFSGMLEVWSGILSGDPSKVFRGMRKELEGLGKIAKGALRNIMGEQWDNFGEKLGQARKRVSQLASSIKGLKGKTVHVAQAGAEKARSAVQGVINTVRRYAGKTVHIAQSGASGAQHAVQSLINTIRRFVGKIVRVGESGAAAAMGRVNGLISAIRRLFGKVVRVGANVFGTGSVWGLVNAIRSVVSKIVNVGANIVGKIPGFAHGGIVGAAGGGPRSGLVWVGEQGRELVRLPAGSQVYPHGQSESMAQGSGGTAEVVLGFVGDSDIQRLFIEVLKKIVRVKGGKGPDAVQKTFGWT